VFRRRRENDPIDSDAGTPEYLADDADDTAPETVGVGPWDILQAPVGVGRIDLGSLLLPALEGIGIDLQVDPAGNVGAVTAILVSSAVQLSVFAASRSEGLWESVRKELRGAIGSSAGLVDETDGPFGKELRANIPMQAPDGTSVVQPARFVGFDGPRWFLRAMFQGEAAVAGGDPAAEAFLRDVVVVRGGEAKAPGEALLLHLPTEAASQAPAGRPPLNPFERGPEVTEVR
jgi:hypothetical protein